MKKIVYILLLVSQVFWAQDAFEKGNQFYQKEDYRNAVSQYESILASETVGRGVFQLGQQLLQIA